MSIAADKLMPDLAIRYGVSRNMAATDKAGYPVSIALVVVEFPNGERRQLAVREDEIRFKGEALIEQRVREAAVA